MRRFPRKRVASAGWVIAVVFLGLIMFAFLFAGLVFVGNQVNSLVGGIPSFANSYDPNTNSFMDLLMFTGLAVFVAFGAIIEVINISQKRKSGEEVI